MARSRSIAVCLSWAAYFLGMGVLAKGDDLDLAYGRWRVESNGLGWPCRLIGLEVRESHRAGEAWLFGLERGDDGKPRRWGSSKIESRVDGPRASRWYAASWASGTTSTLVQVRPEAGGRLLAVVRERTADFGGEIIRQVLLAPVSSDESGDLPESRTGRAARLVSEGNASFRLEVSGVFAAGSDGGEARPVALPDGFATAAQPCWSPDGRSVAFAGFDGSGRDPLIRVASASGGPSIAVAAGSMPTWSADGSRIAYVASGRADYATDWSAPGRNDERIESIRLAGPDSGRPEVLARGIWPRWSPADGRLAFVGRADANWDIYVRSADGLALARLTDDPALDTQPTWAADGRSLVFLSDRGNRWDLYRVRFEPPGRAERLTDHVRREDHPSLSPDGRRVAFVDGRARPAGSILLLDLARGTARPFPEHPDGDRDPSWSPDGRSIAFVSRRPGPLLPPGGARP